MSGSKPSRTGGLPTNSPHSLGGIPSGNRGSKRPNGDRGHNRARNSTVHPFYSNGFHWKYTSDFVKEGHPIFSREGIALPNSFQPYQKRIVPDYIPSPSSGPVGPDIDWSVRARNLPIIFVKRIKHMVPSLKGPYLKAEQILFPPFQTERSEAKYRPQVGCYQTLFWSDFQVQTWTRLAHHLGVQYSGKREYIFPKGTLGKVKGGSYYGESPYPWPYSDLAKKDLQVLSYRSNKRCRSEFSRIKRSLKRFKQAAVKPLDFTSILHVRRLESLRELKRRWDKGNQTFEELKGSTPLVLSLSCLRKAHPVPQIVLEALTRIASRTAKLVQGKPWILPKAEPKGYDVRLELPPRKEVVHKLRAYASADGNIYFNRTEVDGSMNLLVQAGLTIEQVKPVRKKLKEVQDLIDDFYPQDPPEDALPAWDDPWRKW